MAKTAKKLKYINGALPEDIGALLANADENDLKILIALMMAADGEGEIPESFSVSEALGLERADVTASVKFWRGAGVLEGGKSGTRPKREAEQKPKAEEKQEASGNRSSVETAHRDGAVEVSNNISSYRSDELATLLEDRKISAEFIDEAQRVFGKSFNAYDTGIVVSLIDRLGFEEEAVLAILAYMTRIGKRGLRYTEKVAMGFYDDGYTTTREVVDRIAVIEQSKEVISKVRQLFGADNRELSRSEKTMFERWTQKLGYGIEVIKLAYDITVDIKHEAIPKYANAILEKWYNEGLRTEAEVLEYEKKKKEDKDDASKKSEVGKSYDLDEFFEAAIKRTFDDMK